MHIYEGNLSTLHDPIAQVIHELGLDAAQYGGYTLRNAINDRDWRTIEFLLGDKLRIEFPDNDYDIGYIEFFPFTDTIEMKAGWKKLLRLSKVVAYYTSILLVWNPKTKCVSSGQYKHRYKILVRCI